MATLLMDSREKWYSVKEVAAILGVSPDTVRRMVYRGDLKALILPRKQARFKRIFRVVRVADTALREFMERNRN